MVPPHGNPADLEARLHVLERENEMLAERAEELALVSLVAERINAHTDRRSLLEDVLERISILKDLPYCACLTLPDQRLAAAYHSRRHGSHAPDRIRFAPGALGGQRVFAPGDVDSPLAAFDLHGVPFSPRHIALLPFHSRRDFKGYFLFADDARTREELEGLLLILQHVVDMTVARLDLLFLVEELQEMNKGLDEAVGRRTLELRQVERRQQELFDRVPDAVLLIDAEPDGFGRIRDANAVASATLGYSIEELKTLNIQDLRQEDEAEFFKDRVARLFLGETVTVELVHWRKDGTSFPVETVISLVTLEGHCYFLRFARDITKRLQAEEAMRQGHKMESVGLLAGGIAHDFNNLLGAILGQTSLAAEKIPGGHPALNNLQKAILATERAADLTQQLLAYSGRGKFNIQALDLNRLITENLHLLTVAIPKNVELASRFQEDLPGITADLGQMQQVVMNLVINAADAIGGRSGSVRVSTSRARLTQEDMAAWARSGVAAAPGDYVLMEVSDDGCGMTEATRARIFDPFFSTKVNGRGLGLAAVQGIVRGHKGAMRVKTHPGQGTTFTLAFPADPAGVEAQAPRLEAPGPRSALRILVIDDEEPLLQMVQDVLQAKGHSTFSARSGREGVACFEAHRHEIDLVLLDLSMPGLDGVETYHLLKAVEPAARIILSSGFAEEEATGRFGGLHLAGFLQKPYRPARLLGLVEGV